MKPDEGVWGNFLSPNGTLEAERFIEPLHLCHSLRLLLATSQTDQDTPQHLATVTEDVTNKLMEALQVGDTVSAFWLKVDSHDG